MTHPRTRRERARHVIAACTLAVLGPGLVACAGSSTSKPDPLAESSAPSSPAPSASGRAPSASVTPSSSSVPWSPPPSEGSSFSAEQQEVLAQYRGFWEALPKADRLDEVAGNALLKRYSVNPEYMQVTALTTVHRIKGWRIYGDDVLRPQSVSIDGNDATVIDCQDSSASGVEVIATGKKLTVGPPRNSVRVTLQRTATDPWKVATTEYLPGKC